jgi:hypothetical protein
VGESLGAVAGDDEDMGVEGGELCLGDGGPAGDAIEGFGLVLVVDEIDLRVEIEEVEIGALDAFLLLLTGFKEVALHKLAIVGGLDGGAGRALLLLMAPQFLLDFHLDLLEDLELAFVGGGLIAAFAAHVDVVGDGFVGDGASVGDEGAAVGQLDGTDSYHLRQLVLHLLVCQLGLLYAVVLLQQTPHAH